MSESLDVILQREYLEALRSGEYKKCKGYPKIGDRYCAIGVAADVYSKITGKKINFNTSDPYDIIKFMTKISPIEIWERSDAGKSFIEIADYLEKEWQCEN